MEREFTHTFGGCTILRGLHGSYLSKLGWPVRDRINLIYADAPFAVQTTVGAISRYTERIKEAVSTALREEAVLVVVFPVHHAG